MDALMCFIMLCLLLAVTTICGDFKGMAHSEIVSILSVIVK